VSAYAPSAIQALFDTVNERMPSAVLGGIYASKPGYHNARNQVSGNDYSVQTPPDRLGNGNAASAVDITWNSEADIKTASSRLMDARNDPRMYPIREFYGSEDGVNVCGWDYYGDYPVTSDDSHLWHNHLSVLREFADDYAALQGVADVITGRKSTNSGGDDMPKMVQLSFAGELTISPGVDTLIKWDKEGKDPDNMVLSDDAPSDNNLAARINLGKDGKSAYYTTTFTCTVKGLKDLDVVQTGLVFCDLAGNPTGNSPNQAHVQDNVNSELNVLDSRGMYCSAERGIKIRMRTPVSKLTVTKAQWTVLYWK
jgi:hypothetical protein